MAIEKELLDRLLTDYNYLKPEELIGENGLLKQLTKGLLERALQAEMTVHLGHENNGSLATKGGNSRNGKSAKTIKGEFGSLPIEVHSEDAPIAPHAKHPVPGSADLCFITSESINTVIDHLHDCNVFIEAGPVSRTGALGPIISVYFRDPDGNVIEISSYQQT